jgi:hypothetical protein
MNWTSGVSENFGHNGALCRLIDEILGMRRAGKNSKARLAPETL